MDKINLLTGRLGSGGRMLPLTQGQYAIVDDEDFERVNRWKWCAQWNPGTKSFYAGRGACINGKWTSYQMHRLILGVGYGDPRHIDHENHNTTDNRKRNLKVDICHRNFENRIDKSKWGTGVGKVGKRFRCRVKFDGVVHHLGYFDTPEEAQNAREEFLSVRT